MESLLLCSTSLHLWRLMLTAKRDREKFFPSAAVTLDFFLLLLWQCDNSVSNSFFKGTCVDSCVTESCQSLWLCCDRSKWDATTSFPTDAVPVWSQLCYGALGWQAPTPWLLHMLYAQVFSFVIFPSLSICFSFRDRFRDVYFYKYLQRHPSYKIVCKGWDLKRLLSLLHMYFWDFPSRRWTDFIIYLFIALITEIHV